MTQDKITEIIKTLEKHSPDETSELGEAMKKQAPTYPIHKEKNLYCPNCDHWLLWDDAIPNEWDNYCGICGQAIDWSEE